MKCFNKTCNRTRHEERDEKSTHCCVYCVAGRTNHTQTCNERYDALKGIDPDIDQPCSETDINQMCNDCREGYEIYVNKNMSAGGKNMSAEQVVEMIDAITEGRVFTNQWEESDQEEGENRLNFSSGPLSFTFSTELFACTNPRTAREIAGALVAWANRKGKLTQDEIDHPEDYAQRNVYRRPSNSHRNRGYLPSGEKADTSRAEWYKRSIGFMGQEAKDRNLKDLLGIQAGLHPNDVQDADVTAAIQILRDNGAQEPKARDPKE